MGKRTKSAEDKKKIPPLYIYMYVYIFMLSMCMCVYASVCAIIIKIWKLKWRVIIYDGIFYFLWPCRTLLKSNTHTHVYIYIYIYVYIQYILYIYIYMCVLYTDLYVITHIKSNTHTHTVYIYVCVCVIYRPVCHLTFHIVDCWQIWCRATSI